jgi:hypothetical protein
MIHCPVPRLMQRAMDGGLGIGVVAVIDEIVAVGVVGVGGARRRGAGHAVAARIVDVEPVELRHFAGQPAQDRSHGVDLRMVPPRRCGR